MTDITPPPELAAQWVAEIYDHPATPLHSITLPLVERAAQWGADEELEACCAWLPKLPPWSADDLRRHRRPKPPSLKEQALQALETLQQRTTDPNIVEPLRRALEALPDD